MKLRFVVCVGVSLLSNLASANSGVWREVGGLYLAEDDFVCSGAHYSVIVAEERGGGDVINHECNKIGAKISLITEAQEGYDCSQRPVYQDLLCVDQKPLHPSDEFVNAEDKFSIREPLAIEAGAQLSLHLGTVDRPGHVVLYIRSNLDLAARDIEGVTVDILQSTTDGRQFIYSVISKDAPYAKSNEAVILRNFDITQLQAMDESVKEIVLSVKNSSDSTIVLKTGEFTVKTRAD